MLVEIPTGQADSSVCILVESEEGGVMDVERAIDIAQQYGAIDGDHHKMWVIDQMVRALTGDGYEEWVTKFRDGEDGPDTYAWDGGIAP